MNIHYLLSILCINGTITGLDNNLLISIMELYLSVTMIIKDPPYLTLNKSSLDGGSPP